MKLTKKTISLIRVYKHKKRSTINYEKQKRYPLAWGKKETRNELLF